MNRGTSENGQKPTLKYKFSLHSDQQIPRYNDWWFVAGDIRSLLTPKKPQRPSAFSASRGESEIGPRKSEDASTIYETLPPTTEEDEEEDHYTYLDEAEVRI